MFLVSDHFSVANMPGSAVRFEPSAGRVSDEFDVQEPRNGYAVEDGKLRAAIGKQLKVKQTTRGWQHGQRYFDVRSRGTFGNLKSSKVGRHLINPAPM